MPNVLSNMLWIPKDTLSLAEQARLKVRYTLEGKSRMDGIPVVLKAYSENDKWLGIPRQSYGAYPGYVDQTVCPHTNWPALQFPAGGGWRGNQEATVDKLVKHFKKGNYGARLEAPCGSGKGQLPTAKILTPTGWKQFKDLKINDLVIDPDTGCACEVMGVFPKQEQKMYRITFSDSTNLEVDSSHLWYVETQTQRYVNRGGGEVVSTEWLSGQLLKDSADRSKFFIPINKPVQFNYKSNIRLDPYLLGMLLGDGNMSQKCVSFSSLDDELVQALAQLVAVYDCKISNTFELDGKCPCYRISNTKKRNDTNYVFDCLQDWGLMGCKSETKFIPTSYIFGSFSDRVAILQGLFDTDGYPDSKGSCEYCTVSEQLRDQVEFIVRSLGGTVTTTLHQKCTLTKFQAYRLRVKLPAGVPLFRLTRKLQKSCNPQRGPFKSIIKIEKLQEMKKTICISVNSKRSLYITDNFTVTHNTVLSLMVAQQLGVPTIILTHKDDLAQGWHTEALKFFPGVILGHVQGDSWNYVAGHATTAMVQTLYRRRGKYPPGFTHQFGMVIIDEGHRFSAQTFEYVMKVFPARYRLAVSATWRRRDDLDAWDYHIGPKVATCKIDTLTGRYVPVGLNYVIPGIYPTTPMAIMLNLVAQNKQYNTWLAQELVKAAGKDRKVLLLSDRIDQLRLVQTLLDDELHRCGIRKTTSLYIGEMEEGERQRAKDADVILGTFAILSEGTNIPTLDTLIFGTPRSDVEQCVGRIQRAVSGKKSLLVVDPILLNYKLFTSMYRKRKFWYTKLGFLEAQK